MNNKIRVSLFNTISMCFVIMYLTVLEGSASAADYKVHFRSVSFLMSCNKDTPKIFKNTLGRSPVNLANVNEGLCFNSRKTVEKIKPNWD